MYSRKILLVEIFITNVKTSQNKFSVCLFLPCWFLPYDEYEYVTGYICSMRRQFFAGLNFVLNCQLTKKKLKFCTQKISHYNMVLLLTENWPMFEEARPRSILHVCHGEEFSRQIDKRKRCKWNGIIPLTHAHTWTHMKLT